MEKVDFVILWVDGNDEKWLNEKNIYDNKTLSINNSDVRYRDWEIIKYWFRSIEKYAPWVNNIFFITYGHLPKWLNTNASNLKIVRHEEFIPKKYLPTFSSDVIEMNLFRIKELSNNFVLFNDDMILNKKTDVNIFFKNNLPVDCFVEDSIQPLTDFSKIYFNNEQIINKYFNKRDVYKKNWKKIFKIRYGKFLIRNFLLFPWSKFSTFKNFHLSQPMKKEVLQEIWKREEELLDKKCLKKFRSDENITQYLVRDWQLVSGRFYPGKINGKMFNIEKDMKLIKKQLKKSKLKILCLNDSENISDFEGCKKELIESLESKFNKKSKYEK